LFLNSIYMKNYIFLLLLACLLASCCDDEAIPVANCLSGLESFAEEAPIVDDTTFKFCQECFIIDCEEVYSSDIPFDYYYPCFNPNNPEQLAYCRDETTVFKLGYELWVIDFCTGEKKMLVDNLFYGLDWSVKDWLIYTATDQNIWKIKSNGDSLTQLTFVGNYNRLPKWSPSGSRIAYNTEQNGETHFIIASENGVSIDTIDELYTSGAWSWIDEKRICYWIALSNGTPTPLQMNYYNLETKEIKSLHTLTVGSTNDSLVQFTAPLLRENSVLWFSIGLIGKTDLETGNYEIIRKRGRQEWFQEQMSVRPRGEQILYNNRVMHSIDECHLDSEFGFFLIDIDGKNNKRIKMPE